MLSMIITGRTEEAGIQIPVFWLWILSSFYPHAWLSYVVLISNNYKLCLSLLLVSYHYCFLLTHVLAASFHTNSSSMTDVDKTLGVIQGLREEGLGAASAIGEQWAVGCWCCPQSQHWWISAEQTCSTRRWGKGGGGWRSGKLLHAVRRLHISADRGSLKVAEKGFLFWCLKISFPWVLVTNYSRKIKNWASG